MMRRSDEEALPEEQQTSQREHSMKYLQGPNGSCLREDCWLLINFIKHTLQTFIDSGSLSL